jgi:hypothetical protein
MTGRFATPTRRELLIAGAAGAALAPVALAPSALSAPAAAASGPGVADRPVSVTARLARLAGLELLMAYCYEQILASSLLGPDERQAITPLREQEQAHSRALQEQLTARGATAPAAPGSVAVADRHLAHRDVGGRLGQLRGRLDAIRLLFSLERVTVGAYFVALTTFEDPRLVVLIAEMMACDAQHEAILSLALPPYSIEAAVPYGLVQGVQ